MAEAYPPENLPPARPGPSPWWLIARGPAIAASPRVVILAALGMAALRGGWSALASAFGRAPWEVRWEGFRPGLDGLGGPMEALRIVVVTVLDLYGPFVALFAPDVPAADRLAAGLAAFWVLFVWGLFGTAIVRVAAVRVARGESVGIVPALGFSLRRLGSTLAAPIAPILVAGLIAVPGALVGLLGRVPGSFGRSAATALAFVPLAVGLLDAVMLLGLALAWPLMIATVAAEDEDFFDAISRSYSYVNQRLARYAAYLLAALAIGAIGLGVASVFVASALGLADWSTSLGAPRHEGFRFLDPAAGGLPAAAWTMRGAVGLLAEGWLYGYLWSAAAIIYLILRRDVDGAEVEELGEGAGPRTTSSLARREQ